MPGDDLSSSDMTATETRSNSRLISEGEVVILFVVCVVFPTTSYT